MSLLGKHFRPFCIQLARCGLPTKYVTGRAFATGQVCRLPVMHLNTNLKEQDIPADFERKLCEKIGEVLDKPLEKITLNMHTGQRQLRAGSADPMVCLDIHSIDRFDQHRNPTYTPPLLSFLSRNLNLPEHRVIVVYHDLLAVNVGQGQK